jgi:hypothetical protein
MKHDNDGRITWKPFAFGLRPIKAAVKLKEI